MEEATGTSWEKLVEGLTSGEESRLSPLGTDGEPLYTATLEESNMVVTTAEVAV